MALVDYEAAFLELHARIVDDEKKTSWGRDELLLELGKILASKRVPEDLLEAASRLTGFPFIQQPAETPPSSDGDLESPAAMASDHRPPTDRGGHDGTTRATAGNGISRTG